jgi:hypothetical protein
MAVQKIEVAALNIVASPHPKGVYREILSAIANKEVTLWGSDRGKITEFQEMEDKPNLLYGRVLVWGEIDKDGKWLNENKNIEATPEEKQKIAKAIPEDYEPNFRSFYFVFIEDKQQRNRRYERPSSCRAIRGRPLRRYYQWPLSRPAYARVSRRKDRCRRLDCAWRHRAPHVHP